MSADAAVALLLLVAGWTLLGLSAWAVGRWDARRRSRLDRDGYLGPDERLSARYGGSRSWGTR